MSTSLRRSALLKTSSCTSSGTTRVGCLPRTRCCRAGQTRFVVKSVRLLFSALQRLGVSPSSQRFCFCLPNRRPKLTFVSFHPSALRLFHSLLHVDQITLNCKPILPMELVTSSYPGNYNDADLSPDGLVRPQPDSVRTAVTYERIRSLVGIVQRRFQDDVASDPSSIDYSTVLQCDMDLRGLIQQYELTRPDPHESTTALWSRLLSRQNIEIRRIRINRPCPLLSLFCFLPLPPC